MHDTDIWRSAKALIDNYGDDASKIVVSFKHPHARTALQVLAMTPLEAITERE